MCVCGHSVATHAGGGGRCEQCFCEGPTVIDFAHQVIGPVTLENYGWEGKG